MIFGSKILGSVQEKKKKNHTAHLPNSQALFQATNYYFLIRNSSKRLLLPRFKGIPKIHFDSFTGFWFFFQGFYFVGM